MKSVYISGIFAAAALLVMASACSDNYNADLEPVKTDRVLEVTIDGNKVNTIDLKASPGTMPVEVKSNTRWAVDISNCDGGWCSVSTLNGMGDGSFEITVLDNMREVRDCDVTVYMTDAEGQKDTKDSWTIKVNQEVSNVRLNPSSIESFAAQDPRSQEFSIISNVNWTLDVAYEGENPTKFVTITPISGMTDQGDGSFGGSDGATFRINLQDNRTAADRRATLNLRSDVSTYSVEIVQNKAEYTFDVTPFENQVVPAWGGTIDFGVRSISGWKIETTADWISFSVPSMSEGSSNSVKTVATFAPNMTGRERQAQIYFNPTNSNYTGLSVTVTQMGYDLTYNVSRTDAVGVVSENGESLYIELDTRFAWEATASSWITLSSTSGNESMSAQTISANVKENQTIENRTGVITITPLPTVFEGGVTLDPAKLGVEPIHLGVIQSGGRKAAISIPWLEDSYTQTSATISFNFYSPFYTVVEAGLEWGVEGATEFNKMTQIPTDGKNCTMRFELTDLDSATKYVARGYIIDETDGQPKYSDWSYPFTTAGRYPNSGDNPTPSN